MNPHDSEKINWSILLVIILGTFMAILDSSIVNVALPKLMSIFNSSPDDIEWILTAYMLTMGVVMPLTGFLGDTFGYKRVYIFALMCFVAGSALCGMSWSVNSMIVARIIQALGGGIMQPLGMAIIYQSFPRSKMGMVLGFWGIAAMAAPAIGPTLGGYLVDYISWRIIFYINVPIGLLNVVLAGMILKETPLIRGKSLDIIGLITSSVGLFCLLLGLSKGTVEGWTSPYIMSLFAIAIVSLVVFVINELNHPDPILELRIFKNFLYTISSLISCALSIGLFGAIFMVPLLLQNVLGQSAMKTGIIMFPAAIASAIMMPIGGRLFDRYGARGVVSVGLGIVAWTTYVMSGFNALTPYGVMTIWMVIRSGGMGLAMMPASVVGMNTVPISLVGRASAMSNVVRQVSASLGIAMFTTIMQHRQIFHYANIAQSVNLGSTDYLAMQAPLYSISTTLGIGSAGSSTLGLSAVTAQVAKLSMVNAIDDCFIVAAAICFSTLLLTPFLKEKKAKVVLEQADAPAPTHALAME
ncbi:MAG: DHA2 family efflux MFS transporter permease subunit [Acidobacteriota bacterium]